MRILLVISTVVIGSSVGFTSEEAPPFAPSWREGNFMCTKMPMDVGYMLDNYDTPDDVSSMNLQTDIQMETFYRLCSSNHVLAYNFTRTDGKDGKLARGRMAQRQETKVDAKEVEFREVVFSQMIAKLSKGVDQIEFISLMNPLTDMDKAIEEGFSAELHSSEEQLLAKVTYKLTACNIGGFIMDLEYCHDISPEAYTYQEQPAPLSPSTLKLL